MCSLRAREWFCALNEIKAGTQRLQTYTRALKLWNVAFYAFKISILLKFLGSVWILHEYSRCVYSKWRISFRDVWMESNVAKYNSSGMSNHMDSDGQWTFESIFLPAMNRIGIWNKNRSILPIKSQCWEWVEFYNIDEIEYKASKCNEKDRSNRTTTDESSNWNVSVLLQLNV